MCDGHSTFGRLVADPETGKRLRVAIRRYVQGEDVEDVVQETLLRAHAALRRGGDAAWRGQAQMSTWLWRIAVNTAINWGMRDKAWRQLRGAGEWEDVAAGLAADGPLPEDAVEFDAYVQELAQELPRLRETYREAMRLAMEGLSMQEIGDVLGLPVNTVKTWLWRARRELREAMRVRGW